MITHRRSFQLNTTPYHYGAFAMSKSSVFRIGGIAAILGLVLFLGYYVWPPALALGALAFAVFDFALYRLFSPESPVPSLVAAVVGIGGAIFLAVLVLVAGVQNNTLQNLALWATVFAPPLLFGALAYRHAGAGMPRALALAGIAGGAFGLINLILALVGGGDWSNPSNPALGPVIMASYYVGMLLTLIWIMWTAILLLRRA
jgi:hypothetical protein